MSASTGPALPPDPVTLSRRVWVAVVVVVVLGLAIFSLQLASIESQRHRVVDQDKKITLLLQEAQPVLRAAVPLLTQVRGLTGPIGRTARRAPGVLAQADPLLAGLNRTDAVGSLASAGSLARSAAPLVASLRSSDAPGSLAAVGRLVRALNQDDRFVTFTATAQALLDLLARTDLIRRARRAADVVPLLAALLRRSVQVQSNSLAVQRATLAGQLRALAIAQQTLDHVISLDRKTGGQLPATPVAPVAAPAPTVPGAVRAP